MRRPPDFHDDTLPRIFSRLFAVAAMVSFTLRLLMRARSDSNCFIRSTGTGEAVSYVSPRLMLQQEATRFRLRLLFSISARPATISPRSAHFQDSPPLDFSTLISRHFTFFARCRSQRSTLLSLSSLHAPALPMMLPRSRATFIAQRARWPSLAALARRQQRRRQFPLQKLITAFSLMRRNFSGWPCSLPMLATLRASPRAELLFLRPSAPEEMKAFSDARQAPRAPRFSFSRRRQISYTAWHAAPSFRVILHHAGRQPRVAYRLYTYDNIFTDKRFSAMRVSSAPRARDDRLYFHYRSDMYRLLHDAMFILASRHTAEAKSIS